MSLLMTPPVGIFTIWKIPAVLFRRMESPFVPFFAPVPPSPSKNFGNAAGTGLAFRSATAFSSSMRPGRETLSLLPSVRAAENVNIPNNEPHNTTINP